MKKLLFIYHDQAGGQTKLTKMYLDEIKNSRHALGNTVIKKVSASISMSNNSAKRFKLITYYFSLFKKTRGLIEKCSNITDVYSPSILLLWFVFMHKGRSARYHYHYHGEHFQDWMDRSENDSIVKQILYTKPFYLLLCTIEKLMIWNTQTIFVVSNFSKKQLISLFPFVKSQKKKIIEILPHISKKTYVAKKYRDSDRDSKSHSLLFVGRADQSKGLQKLINALRFGANYVQSSKRFELVIAQTGTNVKEFEKRAREQLTPLSTVSTTFYSNLGDRQLSDLYRKADLTILPSEFEQLPLVFIESISCGTPVLSTRVGEVPRYQKLISGELLLANNNPSEIAAGIDRYFNLPLQKRKEIFNHCLSVSKKFYSKGSFVEALEEAITTR